MPECLKPWLTSITCNTIQYKSMQCNAIHKTYNTHIHKYGSATCTYIHTYVHTYIHTLHTLHALPALHTWHAVDTNMHAYIHAKGIHTYHACMHTWTHTYVCVCISTIHTYLQAYLHTYVHKCIHTHTPMYIRACVHAGRQAGRHTDTDSRQTVMLEVLVCIQEYVCTQMTWPSFVHATY